MSDQADPEEAKKSTGIHLVHFLVGESNSSKSEQIVQKLFPSPLITQLKRPRVIMESEKIRVWEIHGLIKQGRFILITR